MVDGNIVTQSFKIPKKIFTVRLQIKQWEIRPSVLTDKQTFC